MSQTSDTCEKCGQTKDRSGRLTQWIVGCTCTPLPAAEKSQETPIELCQICKKRLTPGRAGSFTQWIFRQDVCSCDKKLIVPADAEAPGPIVHNQLNKQVRLKDDGEAQVSDLAPELADLAETKSAPTPIIVVGVMSLLIGIVVAACIFFLNSVDEVDSAPPVVTNAPTIDIESFTPGTATSGYNVLKPHELQFDEGTVGKKEIAAIKKHEATLVEVIECTVSDEFLDGLTECPQVNFLTLKDSVLPPNVGTRLAKLTQVDHLNLHEARITDKDLECVRCMPQLRWIGIGGTNISNKGFANLAACPNLDYIEGQSTQLQGDQPWLSKLTKLKKVDFSHTHINDAAVARLAQMQHLEKLYVWDCKNLTGKSVHSINRIPSLRVLWIGDTSLKPADISILANAPSLRELSIEGITIGGNRGIDNLLKLRQVSSLSLARSDLTDAGLMRLASLPSLRGVAVYECPHITSAGIAAFKTATRNSINVETVRDKRTDKFFIKGHEAELKF